MRRQKFNFRNKRGAVLVEGVVALSLIILGVVCGTLLLADTGLSIFYKEKLGFVSNQTSLFAASLKSDDPKLQEKVQAVAEQLLAGVGLPKPKEVKVTNSSSIVQVSVTLDNLPLTGDGSILPLNLTLSDTSAALRNNASGGINALGFLDISGAIVPVVAYGLQGTPGTPAASSVFVAAPGVSPEDNANALDAINRSGKLFDQLKASFQTQSVQLTRPHLGDVPVTPGSPF